MSVSNIETENQGTASETAPSLSLEPLFEAKLWYTSESPEDAVIPPEGREGAYIGSGEGTVSGEVLKGTMRWSFYAADCVYLLMQRGEAVPPGQHLCYENPGGFIETHDGARIRFDAKGYGLRGFDPARPHLWHLVMGLQFNTDDPRYAWLNTRLGVWDGQFNEQTTSADVRAYLQRADR